MKFLWVFFFGVVLLSSVVAAEGLSPSRYEIQFQPGLKAAFPFSVAGEPNEQFQLSLKGDLAPYAQLSETIIHGSDTVIVYLTLPTNILTPGEHRLSLSVVERQATEGFGIIGDARGLMIVHVPYPGSYLEMTVGATNVNIGESVPIIVSLIGRGSNTVEAATSIEVYDSHNTSVTSRSLGIVTLESGDTKEITLLLDTSSLQSGLYHVFATTTYADKKAQAEVGFKIGTLHVSLLDYSNGFERDKINPFDITIESDWNSPIDHVYANVSILNSTVSFLTPSLALGPFEKARLTGFFDTHSITTDPFKARILLQYGGNVTEEIVELHFKPALNYLMIGLIALGIVLLIVVFLVVRYIKRLKARLRR